jgi:peroxiredoxin Q/BCP
MAQLRQYSEEYRKLGVNVVVVGPDGPKAFKRYWEENDLPFIGFADPGSKVGAEYGQEVNLLKLGRMPAQFLIDPEGIIRYAHYSSSMSDIPEEGEVLEMIQREVER